MSKKKGYPRQAYSFERVLKDLADDIGYSDIETVIEKKRTKKINNFFSDILLWKLLCFYFFPVTIILSFNDCI